ncbi:prolipoprotein diacylglyceryl transferase [Mesobacillus jeotgali]|uniref:Phosphatidylglycerol--prolipoprotein diacylglyceryl transferase n=1 Tax=Mesobacillus jeotgali TaxID=129985 RepID=A0ABY9VAW6_9BACI|nr:prolipoprotein diacylglyceryl transferase [Mesobacillus jeotgali]WNF20925.1 prolipoprotein diacylglyceryl transferase [Mesobacillus jeotgali]
MGNFEPINRIALELGPITIYWYGIIIGFGIFLGWLLATKEAKRRGLHPDVFSDLLLWAIPISLLSARLYYVLFKLDYYLDNPGQILAIWEGGIAIHGGLIGAVATSIVYARKKEISFWQLADIAAPSIILGQAIGRWGNFMNQEAHGTEVTRTFLEDLMLPDWIINQMYIEGAYYHPTFLYESLWNLSGFFVLLAIRKFGVKRGEVFLSYLIWYSVGRFFVEGLRTDSLMVTDGLRIAQVMSLVLIGLSLSIALYRRRKGLAEESYKESSATQ